MLWLALHFPLLCLEMFTRGRQDETPLAVVEGQQLLAVCPMAEAEGVTADMRVAEARSLCPSLLLTPRNSTTERQALRRLADWGLHYSSHVSLRHPNGLLLEIGGSLRLFGSLDTLLERINGDLPPLGYAFSRGVAPTPGAAWLLALAGDAEPVGAPEQLRVRLAPLPCGTLDMDARQREALIGLGLRTLGDCLALPRADLGHRLGGDLLMQLERALGERPDPRPAHRAARAFHADLPLPADAHDTESILFALQRLLRDLAALLRSLEAGVQQMDIRLDHERRPCTRLTVGLQTPSRDAARLLAVSRERLERQPLEAPVTSVGVDASRLLALAPEPHTLLEDPDRQHQQHWQHLAERLIARLGEDTVRGVATAPEHRPERAWRALPPGRQESQQTNPHRPLWLLPRPRPLEQHQGHPCWDGLLALCDAPERIESGWWDGDDISRDYYTARTPAGAMIWIYRDRRPPRRWFLHGFFG